MTCPGDLPPTQVRVRRMLPATPERVFAAWTNADSLKQWFRPGLTTSAEVELDVRPDGHFRIFAHSADGDHEITGVYQEVTPPTRLVFTWNSPHTRGAATLVTVELREVGGQTELTLTHERLPDPDAVAGHQRGWDSIAAKLEQALLQ